MRKEFEARRDLVCTKLRAIPRLRFPTPEGAFYVFFDVSGYFGRTLGGVIIGDDVSFCKGALEVAHVNFVPGSAFGMPGFARMSYANSRPELEGGLDQFARWLASGG